MRALLLVAASALAAFALLLVVNLRAAPPTVATPSRGPASLAPRPPEDPGRATLRAPERLAPPAPVLPTILPPAPPTSAPAPSATALGSPLARPDFSARPELAQGITIVDAERAAERGATPIERQNGIGWLMSHGTERDYPLLRGLRSDGDPSIRAAADTAAHVLRSRFPSLLTQPE